MVAENKKDFYNGLFFENTGKANKNFFGYLKEVKGDNKKKLHTEENRITDCTRFDWPFRLNRSRVVIWISKNE